jgi:hypothetical protein
MNRQIALYACMAGAVMTLAAASGTAVAQTTGSPALLVASTAKAAVAFPAPAGMSASSTAVTGGRLTFVTGTLLSPPHVVLGADNRQHLVHELQLLNNAPIPVALKRLDTIDPTTGAVLQSREGDALAAVVKRPEGLPFDGTMSPGTSALVFADGALSAGAPVPKSLTHRITIDFDVPPGFPATAKTYQIAPTVVVQDRPVVISPPLRGDGWVAVNGCCDTLTSHIGGVVPVDGLLTTPERFAIDFVKVDAERRLFTGPVGQLSGYTGYGEPVLSVAAGTVVGVHRGEPDQTPPQQPPFSLETAGGNSIVVDIGHGRFAYYAHLMPGSLKVKPGDTVTPGQILARLGNSGNSTAPHLHFHIMNGPTTPLANSLPYEFDSFISAGTVTDQDVLFQGAPAPIGPQLAGNHRQQLPLNLQVITFR